MIDIISPLEHPSEYILCLAAMHTYTDEVRNSTTHVRPKSRDSITKQHEICKRKIK